MAPGILELKGMTEFKPSQAIADHLDARKESTVQVRFGNLAQGPVTVKTRKKGEYTVTKEPVPLAHPLFARAAEALPGLTPSLVVTVDAGKVTGQVGLAAGRNVVPLAQHLARTPELIGLVGFSIGALPGLVNAIEGGNLRLGLRGIPVTLGSAFSGSVSFDVSNDSVAFSGSAAIQATGLAKGSLDLKRSADGQITGKASVGLNLPKQITGSVEVAWDGQSVTGEGKVGYKGEKLSGEVTLRLMERGAAAQLEASRKAPEGSAPAVAPAAKRAPGTKVDYVVFGDGDLAFSFTDWLTGTARVIVDPSGFLTVLGKITPQKEFILFEQKDYIKQLFKVEVRASYGIPVVGNIFIFANVGMDAFAKVGPAKFYNIVVDGEYSTDPKKLNSFSIRGSLNISAAAGLRLRAEAGAGLEVLGHDIKAGAGINGIAGIKGYAEATPIIGYREKGAPGQDKKGEFFLRGELEIAAQPFLGLSGDLFVEVDAPWWSPVPDKKWVWPLFGKEWPIGGALGIGASVDYVFGSKEWPKLDFKPVEFSPDKFMTDLYQDKAKSGGGKEQEKPGKWQEKNSKAAAPPAKASPSGNAKPGKAPPVSAAKAKPTGGKRKGGAVDPNARTKSGKTVRELQDEASKKGKKPAGGDPKTGDAPENASEKKKAKEAHDRELAKGLDALEAVTVRYADNGASKEELETAVKSVRRKFKVFKSITVVEDGAAWAFDYVASKGRKKGPPRPGTSAKNPIDILWIKPAAGSYKRITLAKSPDVVRRLRKDLGLPSGARVPLAALKDNKFVQGNERMTAGPVSATTLGDMTVGLGGAARKFQLGHKFRAQAAQSGNDAKDAVNRRLEAYGYNREDNLDAPTDGDHVWEKQLGGLDAVDNVWPLKSSVNQESGRRIKEDRKRILEAYKLASLDGVWLRLSSAPGKGSK
ncbi:MAG: hypothetical protein JNL97_01675 [Verrucomicrobiales bacterium]|nr:hypothetical protein [Verrucomicrobiales bacterium]